MFNLVHNFIRFFKIQSFDHHFSSAALLNDKQLEQVGLINLVDQLVDFNVSHYMLSFSPAGKMRKSITVGFTFQAQLIVNHINVIFFEQPLRPCCHLFSCRCFRSCCFCQADTLCIDVNGHSKSFPLMSCFLLY